MIVDVPTVSTCCQGLTLFTKSYPIIKVSEQVSNPMQCQRFDPLFSFSLFTNSPNYSTLSFLLQTNIFNFSIHSSQESSGQFWFGEITQSAPWSRPTVQSTNFIEVLNSESFPMSTLVRLQNQNSAKLGSTQNFLLMCHFRNSAAVPDGYPIPDPTR